MKISKPFILICVLFIALIGVTVWAFSERSKKADAIAQLSSAKKTNNAAASLVKKFTDPDGVNHSVFKEPNKPLSPKDIKNGTAVISKGKLDTISKSIDIKSDQVEYWIKVAYASEARALRAERAVDSAGRVSSFYKSKFIELNYRPALVGDTINTNGYFDYRYNVDLAVTKYSQRKKILGLKIGEKERFIDFASNDKQATISGMNTFSVKQNEPAFSAALQAVSRYNLYTKTIAPGIGIQLAYKRLSLQGDYIYNSDLKKMPFVVGARYNLFSF